MFVIPWQIETVLRLLLSLAAGGIIGYERSIKGIDAGFRTHILVCMSSCAIMLTNLQIFNVFSVGDPTRMPAQVISGVGFLGAGCILVTRQQRIKGVTTAAGLWASACLGLCIGAGAYLIAVTGMVGIYLSMTLLRVVEERLVKRTRHARFYMELESVQALTQFMKYTQKQGMKVTEIEAIDNKISSNIGVVISLHLAEPETMEKLIAEFEEAEGVCYISKL